MNELDMAHKVNPRLLTLRLERMLIWGGSALAGLSLMSLALFYGYRLLASLTIGMPAAGESAVLQIGIGALALGVASSLVGLALARRARIRPDERRKAIDPALAA